MKIYSIACVPLSLRTGVDRQLYESFHAENDTIAIEEFYHRIMGLSTDWKWELYNGDGYLIKDCIYYIPDEIDEFNFGMMESEDEQDA